MIKKSIIDFLIKFIKSKEYNHIRIIYLVAIISLIIIFPTVLTGTGDTYSYYYAKDIILSGRFDSLRTPLYPVFLFITYHKIITVLFQWLIFFVSIAFLYKTLENLKISRRLIFIAMIVYVCHPVFVYYQNHRVPESLCISLSSVFAYYLVAFVKTKKISYCWIFHIIMLCLILLKPGCVFLTVIPITLLFYLFFSKRKLAGSSVFPLFFVLLFLSGYGFIMKKTYGVFGISSVSDINLYWMLRDQDKIDLNKIENNEICVFVSHKMDIKYKRFSDYFVEANAIINQYGWKEFHQTVQGLLAGNYTSFLFDKTNLNRIKENMHGFVGRSIDDFGFRKQYNTYYTANYFPYFNFFTLLLILFFYTVLIVKQIYTKRAVPIISILFLLSVAANFSLLVLTAPNNYGRLIAPSISIILIVCVQCVEWFVLFIRREERQFKLS